MKCEKCGTEISHEHAFGLEGKSYKFCSKDCLRSWKEEKGLYNKKTAAQEPKKSILPKNVWFYVIGGVILIGIAFFVNASFSSYSNRPVLNPAQFSDLNAQKAYQLAIDYPEILKTQTCYCGCSVHSGHKNLLDCFKDLHGSECNTCQEEAIDTIDMYKKGMSTEQIKEQIDSKYGGLMSGHGH